MSVELTMKRIRPFWGRVSVSESPVDEETRDSGLVVPLDELPPRGVVLEVDRLEVEGGSATQEWYDALKPGTVVYYKGGTKIGDVVIVEINDILAIVDDS